MHWSREYIASLRKSYNWPLAHQNVANDIVLLCDNKMVPTQWPLARVLEVYHGEDKDVRVIKVNTDVGTYTHVIVKSAVLLPKDHN